MDFETTVVSNSEIIEQMLKFIKPLLFILVPVLFAPIAWGMIRPIFEGLSYETSSSAISEYDLPVRKSKYPKPKQSIRTGRYIVSKSSEKGQVICGKL